MNENETEKCDAGYVTPTEIREILKVLREKLKESAKPTVSEYIRLLDLLRELEPRGVTEVKVGWHDSLRDG